jgi:uncharacterized protein (DUF4415 family)
MENVKHITVTATKADERKPDLNEDWFAEADAFIGTKLVRRGRPKAVKVKRAVSLRLDEEVIDWFKKGGPGWQTRMNDALRKAARV